MGLQILLEIKKTRRASELYRPSDRRLSANLVSAFEDKGCHVVRVMDPYSRILGFLDLLLGIALPFFNRIQTSSVIALRYCTNFSKNIQFGTHVCCIIQGNILSVILPAALWPLYSLSLYQK
jgi:hypothetical protein